MMGMCEATNPVDDELVNVAKSYLSMNDSKVFSSEIANDAGTYIFLSGARSSDCNGLRFEPAVRATVDARMGGCYGLRSMPMAPAEWLAAYRTAWLQRDADAAAALRDLLARHEGSRAKPWRIEDLASDFYEKLARAIVAFEMPIDRIEGKFKLGQNRSQDDHVGMLEGLDAEQSPDAEALAAFIRETLKNDGGV